jgi:ribosomal protein S18 acetylase RimI-like enzyme
MTVAPVRVEVPEAPPIAGLAFRRMRLPDDLSAIAGLFNAVNEADQIEDRNDVEGLAQWYAHADTWDPLRDVLLAEVDGTLIGYGKVHWIDDNDGGRNFAHWGAVHPAWRRRGLGRAILRANQRRLREIAASQEPLDGLVRRFDSWASETQLGAIALLESEGFTTARYFFEMLRPGLDAGEIVEFPLPEGLEVRPVLPEHHPAIWAADVEAFADHWGSIPSSEEAFRRFFSGPDFQPELWRVAWDGDEVAGQVNNMVMRELNAQTGSRRGLLAGVSVRRPWRGRGLARALVSQSLVAFRGIGMTDAVLGVDADNPTGALGVYEANGFVVHQRERAFRKPFDA